MSQHSQTRATESQFDPYSHQHRRTHQYVDMDKHALTDGQKLRQHLDARGEHDAEVYDWHVSKLPAEQVVGMDDVEHTVQQLYTASQVLYKKYAAERDHGSGPNGEAYTLSDRVRAELTTKVERFRAFFHTHPRLFLLMSSRDVSAANRMHVLNLIALKRDHQHKNLSLDQQQQDVSAYMHAHFVRAANPGEEEEAVRNGTGYRGEIVAPNLNLIN